MPPVHILFEDNHLLVVDKPAGLLVQGGDRATPDADDHLVRRAAAWLKARYDKPGNVYVGLVHRLDRNTSGVVVLAKTSKAAERLSTAFASRAVDKTYLALASGLTPARGALEHWLAPAGDGSVVAPAESPGAKRSALSFETLAHGDGASLLAVRLETGRKHQIRVQLAAVGHALLGDRRYAPPAVAARATRTALHAWSVALDHPVRGGRLTFVAPPPADFVQLLERVRIAVTALPRIAV